MESKNSDLNYNKQNIIKNISNISFIMLLICLFLIDIKSMTTPMHVLVLIFSLSTASLNFILYKMTKKINELLVSGLCLIGFIYILINFRI